MYHPVEDKTLDTCLLLPAQHLNNICYGVMAHIAYYGASTSHIHIYWYSIILEFTYWTNSENNIKKREGIPNSIKWYQKLFT
jgi:hypothetical protein